MSIPTHQKALFIKAKQGDWEVSTTDVPKLGPGELLVKVESTALNPADWKIHDYGLFITEYPAILGFDSAGVVAAIGEGVDGFAVGDQVLHFGSPTKRLATFQQYVIIDHPEVAVKIPHSITFDQAATVPSGVATAGIAIFGPRWANGGAGYAAPWQEGNRGKYSGEPIAIIGGSSSVGQYAIQFAKLAGFSPIITTVSSRNFDLVKSLGATHVVDRTLDEATVIAEFQKITSKPIKIIFDTISVTSTQNLAYDILSPGGKLVLTLPAEIDPSKVTPEKEFWSVQAALNAPKNKEFGLDLFNNLNRLLASGDIKPIPVAYASGGLSSIPTQLERLKKGEISAQKIVVRPGETV